MSRKSVGTRMKRKEDQRFVTGKGRYTDDFNRPHQCYAVFIRSQWAHARLLSIDVTDARAMPGVVDVLTGQDYADAGLGSLPCGWMIHSTDGSEMKVPDHPALAKDKVHYVGDPYAVVLAESLEAGRAAAETIIADVEELPAVSATEEALNAQPIHENIPENRCYHWELGDTEAVDQAFQKAHCISTLEFKNNRLIPNALEPRAALGDYDRGTGMTTLYTTSQNPHVARLVMSAFVGLAPEHKLQIISPDVGGGFGSKIFVYSEEVVCAWASKHIGRPVKWTADRAESFMNDAHGRDHVTTASIAMNDAGDFLAMKVETVANLGAYLSLFASAVPTYLYGTLLAGQYKTPSIHVSVDGVYTNTSPVDAYRGAGRPEATYVVERLVETAARDMGMDIADIRRRNFIPTTAFPYETPVALTYDIGDYEASLSKALEIAKYDDFEARRAASQARGKLRGLGLSCYIEACGLAPSKLAGQLGAGVGLFESAQVRVNPTGNVTVYTGVHSHGQGHETSFAQIVADKFGIDPDEVEVVHGDTKEVQYGLGTYGSRSLSVGGSALVQAADKVVSKGREIAAYKFDVDAADVDFEDGIYSARGTNKSMTFKEVAFTAYVPHDYPIDKLEPGLEAVAFYDPENFTYPAGTYVCEVEIDPETGVTDIMQFVAVDDFGRIINPMIVEGQVQGGLAQGIGQALMENGVYDRESSQLVSGSFMDYTLPRADDLLNFDLDLTETPCTHNPLGVKGCGEAGAIGSPPAVINAITDALGVRDIPMPATPLCVWKALQKKEAA